MIAVAARTWTLTMLAIVGVSLLSFVGVVLLLVRERLLRRIVPILVSFAVGALLGDALLHIVPELAEDGGISVGTSMIMVGGIVGFFVLEKFIHVHHALTSPSEPHFHPVVVANLVGDGVHNFVDGAIIAGAFLADVRLGVTTTLAVALHEIPQELGDLGVLVHAGVKPRHALLLNLMSAATAVAGGLLTLLLALSAEGVARPMLAITAGGFIYIAGADLIPELHRQRGVLTSMIQFAGMLGGFAVMGLLLLVE